MKNALILFVIVLPVLVLNQIAFSGESQFLSVIIFSVPFIGLYVLLRKSHLQYSKKEIFKKVFRTCFQTGIFYAIWIGLYQFTLINYIEPSLAKQILTEIEINSKLMFPEKAEGLTAHSTEIIKQPLVWISNQLVINSFFFSIIGLILGFVFKSKASQ